MGHPRDDLPLIGEALDLAREAAGRYLERLPDDPVRTPEAESAVRALAGPLPDDGDGTLKALTALAEAGEAAAIRSAGPRFFHFVVGGATPAGLGADWLTSALDQNVGMWAASPFAAELEVVAVDWLKELFELPAEWGGLLVTGATMANYVGLACARRWWGLEHGVDVDEQGLSALPPMTVLSSGHVHVSAVKALGMLGVGRAQVERISRDEVGRLDLEGLHRRLEGLNGAPAILIANAGEVNAGDFDPLPEMMEAARAHKTWVHVDGAFGLFSRVTPRTKELTQGIERADSVISDGHKWLNVPHDCGFVFVRNPDLLAGVFGPSASYYVGGGDRQPNFALLGPESSRRARALAVWATLRAYGRRGYREMVERHLDLAQRLAGHIDADPDFQRFDAVKLNIVCFRYRPRGVPDAQLDELNERLGRAVLEDGRVYFGTSRYEGNVVFRPAIVNYRTTEDDIDALYDVLRELGGAALRG